MTPAERLALAILNRGLCWRLEAANEEAAAILADPAMAPIVRVLGAAETWRDADAIVQNNPLLAASATRESRDEALRGLRAIRAAIDVLRADREADRG